VSRIAAGYSIVRDHLTDDDSVDLAALCVSHMRSVGPMSRASDTSARFA
jgi:hypothetical protein